VATPFVGLPYHLFLDTLRLVRDAEGARWIDLSVIKSSARLAKGEMMKITDAIVRHICKQILGTVLLSLVAIPVLAQCDGLPHPENGQPAPCGQTNKPLPSPYSGANWQLAEQQRQQQQQDQERARQQQEHDRIHRCELQAQHDYSECTRKNPTGFCPLNPCY
jgi:hypothetical protein